MSKLYDPSSSQTLGFGNVIKMAERVIELEEEGLEDQRDLTGEVELSHWARIRTVIIDPSIDNDAKTATITFKRKLDGSRDHWDVKI